MLEQEDNMSLVIFKNNFYITVASAYIWKLPVLVKHTCLYVQPVSTLTLTWDRKGLQESMTWGSQSSSWNLVRFSISSLCPDAVFEKGWREEREERERKHDMLRSQRYDSHDFKWAVSQHLDTQPGWLECLE